MTLCPGEAATQPGIVSKGLTVRDDPGATQVGSLERDGSWWRWLWPFSREHAHPPGYRSFILLSQSTDVCMQSATGWLDRKAAMQLSCRLHDWFVCRWDKYLPYRSKEALGRAAEASAKQEIKQKAATSFVEKPMMPLELRTEAEAVGGSQSASNFSRSQWASDTIQELRALELGARLRQERAVIGESHLEECSRSCHCLLVQ